MFLIHYGYRCVLLRNFDFAERITSIVNGFGEIRLLNVLESIRECLPDDAWRRTLIVPPHVQHCCHGTRDVTRVVMFDLVQSYHLNSEFDPKKHVLLWVETSSYLGELQVFQTTTILKINLSLKLITKINKP